jgi:2-phospho-L-lactate guanylyltransferase
VVAALILLAVEGILVPVKRLGEAKRRLARHLSPIDRRRLSLAMLADVLRAVESWTKRFLVTSDPDSEAVGLAFGCRVVADPPGGLNPSIDAGTSAAISAGATALLVLPADVPLVTPEDVAKILSLEIPVVIVPSQDGGTNALLRRPPGVIAPMFGPGSAEKHAAAAREAGVPFESLDVDSLRLDIDAPDDLQSLAEHDARRESVRIAREILGY